MYLLTDSGRVDDFTSAIKNDCTDKKRRRYLAIAVIRAIVIAEAPLRIVDLIFERAWLSNVTLEPALVRGLNCHELYAGLY